MARNAHGHARWQPCPRERSLDDAVMESGEAHQNQVMQYTNSKQLAAGVQRLVFDMLLAKGAGAGER